MWLFSQSTGLFTDGDEGLVFTRDAYAGNGEGLNNPAMQYMHDIGPLPRGNYTIGPAYHHAELGPLTMNLEPDPANEMFGRADFRIHGRRFLGDRGASKGCIVLDRNYRQLVSVSQDRSLKGGGVMPLVHRRQPTLDPVDILDALASRCDQTESAAFWILTSAAAYLLSQKIGNEHLISEGDCSTVRCLFTGEDESDPVHIDRVRRTSEALIAGVLRATRGLPEIDILLELGHACPYFSQTDRNIWIAEVHRQRGEEPAL